MPIPAATFGYPGPYNTFAPDHEASGALLVGYSRNANDFSVSRYSQIFPSKSMLGLYYEYLSQNAARIVSTFDAESEWADGDACPPGLNNLEAFATRTYRTKRRVYPFTLGELTIDQMDFDMLLTNSRDMAQRCMTVRTLITQNALVAAFSGSPNTSAVVGGISPPGQGWDTGSVGYGGAAGPNIKTSIQYGLVAIHLQTIGVVREDQLCLVVGPQTAQAMARSTEVQDYLKQSPFALGQLKGNSPPQNGKWGLPDQLYTVNVTVEDAVYINTNKEAVAANYAYILGYSYAFLVARPSKLVGIAGTRSFSTIQIFFYKDEMTMETWYDRNNKRYLSRIISNYNPVIATTKSGFMYSSLWSVTPPVL